MVRRQAWRRSAVLTCTMRPSACSLLVFAISMFFLGATLAPRPDLLFALFRTPPPTAPRIRFVGMFILYLSFYYPTAGDQRYVPPRGRSRRGAVDGARRGEHRRGERDRRDVAGKPQRSRGHACRRRSDSTAVAGRAIVSRAAQSILAVGIYLGFAGVVLFAVPERACRLFALPCGDGIWVRMVAMLFCILV